MVHTVLVTFVLSIFFGSSSLYASYDEDTLNIFSKIIPRFVLMSSQKNKVTDTIEICILHEKLDERFALSLKEKVNANYPNGLNNYKIKMMLSNYSNMNLCENSQLLFLFNSNEENIQNSLHFAKSHTILTMAYDANLLEKGVNISLFMGRKIMPYVNIHSINQNAIEFDNTLLRISKIYSTTDIKQ